MKKQFIAMGLLAAISVGAYADGMKKDVMKSDSSTGAAMKKDAMKQDSTVKEGMKKDALAKDSMKKDDTKKESMPPRDGMK